MTDDNITGIEATTGGFLTVAAGFLPFLPGLLTDLVGAALLIGPIPPLAQPSVPRLDPASAT